MALHFVGLAASFLAAGGVTSPAMEEVPGTLFGEPTRGLRESAEPSASSTPPEGVPLTFETGYEVPRGAWITGGQRKTKGEY